MDTDNQRPTSLADHFRVAVKLAAIGIIALLLLIPLVWVDSLVRERLSRLESVRAEITQTWSGSQTIAGPVVVVPVMVPGWLRDADGTNRRALVEQQAFFLPKDLDWQGTVTPQVRSRGIFEAAVWEGAFQAQATFRPFDVTTLGVEVDSVLWERARLVVGVGDNRGIGSDLAVKIGGQVFEASPGGIGGSGPFSRGVHVALAELAPRLAAGEGLPEVSIALSLDGSEMLAVLPVAETTAVALSSPWTDPSFSGAFLPENRTVDATGFRANWTVPWFARSAEQAWVGVDATAGSELAASAFGVRLALPAGAYQQVERSGKYGLLFLGLTFAAFFVAEIRAPQRLHPIHYGLVGAALVVFYLLLLAFSEHVGFDLAYTAAAAGVVSLVGGYATAILPRGRALSLAAGIAGLYAFLWAALASEDHALLLGAIGVFLALAGVMWSTRRLDWSTLGERARPTRSPA